MDEYYVYLYLRRSDNSPYYVGKGKGLRYLSKNHGSISVPSDKAKICIVANRLFESESFLLERKLIALYGRKDLGTGILLNRTDGGDGVSGVIPWVRTDAHREKIRQLNIGRKHTKETRIKIGLRDYSSSCGSGNPKAKSVKVNGLEFDTVDAAAGHFSMSANTLRDVLKKRSTGLSPRKGNPVIYEAEYIEHDAPLA